MTLVHIREAGLELREELEDPELAGRRWAEERAYRAALADRFERVGRADPAKAAEAARIIRAELRLEPGADYAYPINRWRLERLLRTLRRRPAPVPSDPA